MPVLVTISGTAPGAVPTGRDTIAAHLGATLRTGPGGTTVQVLLTLNHMLPAEEAHAAATGIQNTVTSALEAPIRWQTPQITCTA
jgi:hypothetical protein